MMIQRVKHIFNKGCKYITDADYRFLLNASKFHRYDALPDDVYLKRKYRATFGKELDLEQPETFNEKLQWLKLHDRNPQYVTMVDKHAVKEYIAGVLGERYIIPTIGVWDDPDEIDFDALPERFVLKCNHNSGVGMCICSDKSKLDVDKVRRELRKGLQEDYYLTGREWPYKDVPRKILAEAFMEDSSGEGLTDYKVHVFNGVPRFILVCKDRFKDTGLTEDFFSPEWELLEVRRPKHPNSAEVISRPEELDEILEISARLAENIPFVRVDFYIIDHRVYFSELTFFPASGFECYEPEKWDGIFGSWLELPT